MELLVSKVGYRYEQKWALQNWAKKSNAHQWYCEQYYMLPLIVLVDILLVEHTWAISSPQSVHGAKNEQLWAIYRIAQNCSNRAHGTIWAIKYISPDLLNTCWQYLCPHMLPRFSWGGYWAILSKDTFTHVILVF